MVDEEGAVGALVNNAGYSQSGAVEEVPMEDLRRQFETNVFGLVRMSQLVLPGMRAQGWGRIVNISSMGANFTFPGGGVYHATKYAVEAISDAMRFEVKGFGVDVVVLQPGLIRTEFSSTAAAELTAAAVGPTRSSTRGWPGRPKRSTRRGRWLASAASPDDVAQAIEKAIKTQSTDPRPDHAFGAHARDPAAPDEGPALGPVPGRSSCGPRRRARASGALAGVRLGLVLNMPIVARRGMGGRLRTVCVVNLPPPLEDERSTS